jgi:hypothetical protein
MGPFVGGTGPLAAREHQDLVDEIQFYRQVLPACLALVLGRTPGRSPSTSACCWIPGAANTGQTDALLAWTAAQFASSSHVRPTRQPEETVPSKLPMSRLAEADPDSRSFAHCSPCATRPVAREREHAQLRIDRELTRRKPSWPTDPGSDSTELLSQLSQLPPDWSLVAYYLAAPTALAWVGSRDGLRVHELGPAEAILRRIDRVKSELNVYNAPTLTVDLAALGDALLRPIQSSLRFNVMVAGGAALSDLPLDLLPVDGRPFIEAHQLLHIQSVREAAHAALALFGWNEPLVYWRHPASGTP